MFILHALQSTATWKACPLIFKLKSHLEKKNGSYWRISWVNFSKDRFRASWTYSFLWKVILCATLPLGTRLSAFPVRILRASGSTFSWCSKRGTVYFQLKQYEYISVFYSNERNAADYNSDKSRRHPYLCKYHAPGRQHPSIKAVSEYKCYITGALCTYTVETQQKQFNIPLSFWPYFISFFVVWLETHRKAFFQPPVCTWSCSETGLKNKQTNKQALHI